MDTQTSNFSAHGVFMCVFGLGVLLTGPSGSGKSETALSLLDKGHQLIADDITLFELKDKSIWGSCPNLLQDKLEIRGLGIFDVKSLFGKKAIKDKQMLSLIIHFIKMDTIPRQVDDYPAKQKEFMGISLPHIDLPYYTTPRRFDLLVEALVRHYKHYSSESTCANLQETLS